MEEKLTICFLGNAYSIHTTKWVKFFADRGHNVHLISYDRPKEYLPPNINLYLIGKKLPFKLWRINTLFNLPLAFCQTKKIIKRIKPDIIHAHYITSYGHLALLTGFRPLVVTAWGSDILITPKESIIAGKIVKSVLKKTDLITCDADHMKEALIRFGADPFKIKIIYFGIDTKKFSPGDGDDELKKELGISGLKSVISLRSLEQIYNIETLIKAMPLVLREVSDARLIIAGIGSYEKKLKKMAKDMNLLKHIKFIGFVLNEDLPRYLRIADVYVSTSLSDGGIASSTAS